MERLHAGQTEPGKTPKTPGTRLDEPAILARQKTAGDQAVCRAVAGGMLARENQADTPVTGFVGADDDEGEPL